jgi:hypothetical protein
MHIVRCSKQVAQGKGAFKQVDHEDEAHGR